MELFYDQNGANIINYLSLCLCLWLFPVFLPQDISQADGGNAEASGHRPIRR